MFTNFNNFMHCHPIYSDFHNKKASNLFLLYTQYMETCHLLLFTNHWTLMSPRPPPHV